jgi:NAD-dependent DNA ligase
MGKVTGKTMVFTGKFELMPRAKAEAMATSHGAKVGSSVTAETSLGRC